MDLPTVKRRSSAFEKQARHQVVSVSLLEFSSNTSPAKSIRKPSTLMPGVLTTAAIPGDKTVFFTPSSCVQNREILVYKKGDSNPGPKAYP
jgi:hypothetical protein